MTDSENILSSLSRRRFFERSGSGLQGAALAWLLGRDETVVIPKATRADHVRDDIAAVDLRLDDEDRQRLEKAFPLPDFDGPLATA